MANQADQSANMPEGGYTVDDLLPGIMHRESGGRRYAVSPKGAIGLYQIMPDTAAQYGYSREDMFDPAKNEDVARRYLGDLMTRYGGNAYMALTAYNEGPRVVGEGTIYPETSSYVRDVLDFTRARGAGQKMRSLADVTGRDISPRMDTSGPIDPSFRGTPSNMLFNRYGRITGDEPGYGGEQSLQQIPQRTMGTIESGMEKGYSAFGSAVSSIGPKLGKLFQPLIDIIPKSTPRTPVQGIAADPGEVIS